MPECLFFATKEDEWGLVECLLQLDCYLVPDLTYDGPDFVELRDLPSYEGARATAKQFFLLTGEYVSPLVMFRIEGSGWNAGKFAIRQRQGGPSLTFCMYSPYEKDGSTWLPTCSVSYYATYRNTITGNYEKITPSLREKYRHIVNHIRRTSEKLSRECDGGVRTYWIMKHAARAIRKGARLGVRGLEDFSLR